LGIDSFDLLIGPIVFGPAEIRIKKSDQTFNGREYLLGVAGDPVKAGMPAFMVPRLPESQYV
jgi:hypothetical protein